MAVGEVGITRGARAALTLLLLINLLNYIDRQILAAVVKPIHETYFGSGKTYPALEWFQHQFGFTPDLALIGMLSMAFMVVYMLAAPIFGRLAEQYSRWTIIAIGVLLWSVASAGSGLAATFGALLLTRCAVGIGEAAYGPVAPTLISDFYPVNMRGRVLSWFYIAVPVGSALGYVIGDRIKDSSIDLFAANLLGIHADSWRWAFYLVMPPGILLGLWSLLMRRNEPPRGTADDVVAESVHPARWRDYVVLVRTPSYVYCSLGMAAMTFAIGGIGFWMPYYLESRHDAGAAPTTVFGAMTVVAGLVATLCGGVAGDRLRARYPGSYFLVSGVAMLVGFPVFLAMMFAPFPWVWVFLFLAVFCLFFNTGPTNTILANVTHPAMRATGFALNILVIHTFGDAISPVVIGIIGDRYSIHSAFLLLSGMFILSGLLWLAGTRHLARDTELAPKRL